ncbi:hypothetical protein CYLTODRAFT_494460 [Cylindrobasidium torrendii FP15055 ss-10]|uniref:Uncharacterized protein n=1 Tax=Cylindrobasidium torrendii FP15055 ss-10 TaxID=1314674 RepID=A0A0D7AXU5_9AGAR|nr:hypothetical protein CYLTODRAFT_494460 [Cylindrobasidium torrendii FP15055 ss-10]
MMDVFERRGYALRHADIDWRSNMASFKQYWNIERDNEGFGAAILQAVTFDSVVCDAVLCTPFPIDMGADDLSSVSLFRKAAHDDSSASVAFSERPRLDATVRDPIEEVIDEALSPAAAHEGPPRQLGISENSTPCEQQQDLDKLFALLVPLAFLDYKEGHVDPSKGANQTCLNLIMACRFMISLGLYDFPVFGLSTSRSRVRLFCAWAEAPQSVLELRDKKFTRVPLDKIQSNISIADANCPEWDISKPRDAIRLGLFLQHLRTTHRDRLEHKFNEVKKEVSDSWKHKDNWTPRERALREWKMSQQKESTEYKEWMKKATKAWPKFHRLQSQVEQARSALNQAKAEVGEDESDDYLW